MWKLDRLARLLSHLLAIVSELKGRGIAFRSLTEQIVAALAAGASKSSVCRTFKVPRSTLTDTLARIGWSAQKPAFDPGAASQVVYVTPPLAISLKTYYSEIHAQVQEAKIMVASRMVQARVPGDIQDAASQIIRASGLTVSDVVRVLMTRIAQDKEIPAVLFQPNAETLAAFAEVERGDLKRFSSVDALFADLHADD